jgi:hypothetical protein
VTLITWKPKKNTERTAVAKHGDLWRLLEAPWTSSSKRHLITSPDTADLRWIDDDQITERVTEEDVEVAEDIHSGPANEIFVISSVEPPVIQPAILADGV